MSDDATLDDFLDADETGERDAAPDDTDPADADPEDATHPPATSTYGWSVDGDACDACGAVVETRWRDEEGLVCGACKEW